MKRVKVLLLQTWFDIAIQHTGSFENAYAIAFANGCSITDETAPGTLIVIPDSIAIFTREVQYLEGKKAIPATGITLGDLEIINPILGIGTMAIGSTFTIG